MSFIIMISFIIHHMVATLHAYFYHDMKPIARPLQDESSGGITWDGTGAIESDGVIHGT
jgi:hypothetical protein